LIKEIIQFLKIKMDRVIHDLLDKNKCNKIKIVFGNKSESFLIDKDIPNDIFTQLLEDLIQKHNFNEINRSVYKKNNKYLIVQGEKEKKATKEIVKEYKLEEHCLISMYDEEEIEEILFPCNKDYDIEVKQKVFSININSLTCRFIEEGEFRFIETIIENNAYREDSLKNLNKIFLRYEELIQKQFESSDNE
jgi:hypothetical protein